MVRIRHVRPADADTAVRGLQSTYHRSPATSSRMQEMLEDPGFLLLLAELGNGYVGYLHGELIDRLDGTRLLLIYDITVAADHRRKGIGTALMRSALAHARDAEAKGCWLIADEENADARAFYQQLDGEEWSAVGVRWVVR